MLVELAAKKRELQEPKYWIIPDKDMRGILQAEYEREEAKGGLDGKAQFLALAPRNLQGWEDRWEYVTGGTSS